MNKLIYTKTTAYFISEHVNILLWKNCVFYIRTNDYIIKEKLRTLYRITVYIIQEQNRTVHCIAIITYIIKEQLRTLYEIAAHINFGKIIMKL